MTPAEIYAADAHDVPVADGVFDRSFTCQILIHIPPDRLAIAMREIVRTTNRYVCAWSTSIITWSSQLRRQRRHALEA